MSDRDPANWSLGALLRVVAGSFQIGERVGPYELLEVLGSGGAAKVFRARGPLGRDVAVKLSRARLDEQGLRRFEREGQLLARFASPGVVQIHTAGEWRGRPFLVMELVEGRSCRELLTTAPRAERLQLVLAIAEALGGLHAAGIVHRDLKPENVLVDAEGTPKISDLGLASGEDLERLTHSGAILGTPLYIAPEQVSGERAGPPADVWALGLMLYEALVGKHPIQGGSLEEVLGQVTRKPIPPPRALDRSIPQAVSAVCERALERDLARRTPEAETFAAELREAIASSARSRAIRWLVWLAAPIVIGGAVWSLPRDPSPPAVSPPRSTRPPAPADPLVGQPWLGDLAAGLPLAHVEAALPKELAPVVRPALAGLGAEPRDLEAALAGPASLRVAAARWLRRLGRREAALWAWARDPACAPAPKALTADRRRARARAALQDAARLHPADDATRVLYASLLPAGSPARVRLLARLADPGPDARVLRAEDALAADRPQDALAALGAVTAPGLRVGFARGQALLALGRPAEARAALEGAWGPGLDPRVGAALATACERSGEPARAHALRARVARLRGAEQAAFAREVMRCVGHLRRGDRPPAEIADALQRAQELQPRSPYAAYYRARAQVVHGGEDPLLAAVDAVRRGPWLAYSLQEGLRAWVFGNRRTAAEVTAKLATWRGSPTARLGRAFLRNILIEVLEQKDQLTVALRELDALLEEHPELLPGWTLRAFLHVRAGRLLLAARDLEVARSGSPECPAVAFYQALLFAAQRAAQARVVKALVDAHQRGFVLWADAKTNTGWSLKRYPELARYPTLAEAVHRRSPIKNPPRDPPLER